MWLSYSSVMELMDFFSPLSAFPARVHKKLNPDQHGFCNVRDQGGGGGRVKITSPSIS